MHATVIIPSRPRDDGTLLEWVLEGYAAQHLAFGRSFDIRIGIDGPAIRLPPIPLSENVVAIEQFPPVGAAAVRNALVKATTKQTDLLIFANDDARPQPNMVETHLQAMSRLPGHSLVLGAAPWERVSPTVLDVLIDSTPMIFSYCHMKPNAWHPFRVAYTINLAVRREDFLESGGFHEQLRPFYYEDLAFACRFLGPQRPGVYYEPAAQVVHRHPMTFDAYLDREELLGIMAPVLAQVCPEAFAVLMSGRSAESIERDFRERLKGDPKVYRLLYRRLVPQLKHPESRLEQPRDRTIENLYQLHIPLKLLAFRLGFVRGMELVEDSNWQARASQGLWRQVIQGN